MPNLFSWAEKIPHCLSVFVFNCFTDCQIEICSNLLCSPGETVGISAWYKPKMKSQYEENSMPLSTKAGVPKTLYPFLDKRIIVN